MAGNTVYVQGSYVDIHDNDVVNLNIDKAEEIHVSEGQRLFDDRKDDIRPDDEKTDILDRLKPVFYNNEDDARLFLKEIKGMQPNDITDLVNRWVKEKRISDYGFSRKGVLWSILSECGLYTKSRQNWCRRVE